MSKLEPTFSSDEELAHAVTHGVGAICAAGLTVLLAREALRVGDTVDLMASILFGLTMTHQYVASTLCHGLPERFRTKRLFETLDYLGIYALIAGTYTPFMVGPLRGTLGYTLLVIVWGIAAVGMMLEVILQPRRVRLSLSIYLGMGWLGLVAAPPLAERLPPEAYALLVGGGTAYTLGVVFYVWRGFRYHHAVWHLFVLLGSALHGWVVLTSAIPYPHE